MRTYALYLHPKGSLASDISSDTLFGATCWGIEAVFGCVGDLLKNRTGRPPFVFSGAFPVHYLSGKDIRFYPRPLIFDDSAQVVVRKISTQAGNSLKTRKTIIKEATGLLKLIQKVDWVSESVLSKIASSSLTPSVLISSWMAKKDEYVLFSNMLVAQSDLMGWPRDHTKRCLPFMEKANTQHNQIDRLTGGTGEGLLFYEHEVFFSKQGGLWALLHADSEIMESYIKPAFRYLSDSGLGANRSSGKGQFDFVIRDAPVLPDAGVKANAFLSLSRYLCSPDEFDIHGPLAYKLTSLWPKREQKFPLSGEDNSSAPIYKRRLRVFEPGSVFPLKQRNSFYGQLAVLMSEREGPWPIYHSGLTIPVFMIVENNGDGGVDGGF